MWNAYERAEEKKFLKWERRISLLYFGPILKLDLSIAHIGDALSCRSTRRSGSIAIFNDYLQGAERSAVFFLLRRR